MAGNIKGITIEFRGDTTNLGNALRQINKETAKIDKELKQVNTALKFNPTSVDLWRQKQQLLSEKVSETKEKLKLLKDEQARMDAEGIDKNSEEYRKLQREIVTTESKCKEFESQLKKIGNVNLRATSEQFKELGNKLTAAGQAMQGISTVAAGITASIGALTVKSGRWADDINTMSKQYGISTADLQKYSAAADLVDVSVETIAKSHLKLEKTMYSAANGSSATADAYKKLGVEITNSDGSLRDSEDVFNDTIAALGGVANETERDALAMKLMGKSASELNPLIEDGGETYKNVAETMKKYGLDIIDQDTLDRANQFNDSIDTIKMIGTVAFEQLGTQLAGYLAPAMEKVVGWVGKIAEWLSNLSPETQATIATVAAVIAVIAPLLLGLGKLSLAVSSIMSLASTLVPILGGILTAVGPVILIIGALVAAGILLYKNWDTIKAKALELKDKLTQVWDNIKAAISNKVTEIKTAISTKWNEIKRDAETIWNIIKTAVTTTVSNLKTSLSTAWTNIKTTASTAWGNIKDAITSPIKEAKEKVGKIIEGLGKLFPFNIGDIIKFKVPTISLLTGSKTVLGKTITYPTGFNVTWNKKGVIFTKPYIYGNQGFGEAGAEGVVPLDPFWKKMDKIAEAATSNAGGITINVYAAQGMNEEALANAVMRKLTTEQNRRRLAWQ